MCKTYFRHKWPSLPHNHRNLSDCGQGGYRSRSRKSSGTDDPDNLRVQVSNRDPVHGNRFSDLCRWHSGCGCRAVRSDKKPGLNNLPELFQRIWLRMSRPRFPENPLPFSVSDHSESPLDQKKSEHSPFSAFHPRNRKIIVDFSVRSDAACGYLLRAVTGFF